MSENDNDTTGTAVADPPNHEHLGGATETPEIQNEESAATDGAVSESTTGTAESPPVGSSDSTATDTAAPADPTREAQPVDDIEALRKQVAELSSQLDRRNLRDQRIIELEQIVSERDEEVIEIKENLKAATKRFDAAVDELRRAIRNRESNQNELPFKSDVAAPTDATATSASAIQVAKIDDPDGKTPLTQIGLTSSQCEKLGAVDVETVEQLEALVAAGKFVPKSVKGIGDKALNQITDKLTAFRREHPNPNEKAPEQVDGQWDPTQFHAGQIARADGKTADDNPHARLSHAHSSWFEGWKKKDGDLNAARNMTPDQATAECDSILELCQKVGPAAVPIVEKCSAARDWIVNKQEVLDKHYDSFAAWRKALDEILNPAPIQESPSCESLIEEVDALFRLCDKAGDNAGGIRERLTTMRDWLANHEQPLSEQPALLAGWRKTLEEWITAPLTAEDKASRAKAAIEQCEKIIGLCAEVTKPEAAEFIDSVTSSVRSTHDWIEENQHVTDEQQTALDNWEEGVRKWLA